jgi:hypothetical protein
MDTVPEAKYAISWYDPEKTILLCEITERWSWDEALAAIYEMNDWISTVQHGVYSVFYFQRSATLLPQGKMTISDMRNLLNTEHPNDQLIILVGASSLIMTLINLAGQIYGLRKIASRFCVAQSIDEALWKVEQHKSEMKFQVH